MAVGTNITAILIFMFLVIDNGSNTADAQPYVTASPDTIKLGLTDVLEVKCSVLLSRWTDVVALMYLTVSRNKNSQTDQSELAIISDLSSGQVRVLTKESVKANGHFKSKESASVSIHWDYPTDQQEGTYICEAVAVDSVGRIVVKTAEVPVTAQSPALDDWKEKVIQIDKSVKGQDILVQQIKNFVETQREKNDRLDRIYRIRYSQFETPFSHKNHSYYVYRFAYANIANAQATCMIIGGYLAEVGDRAEYVAIQNVLKSLKGISHVMIAGTDEGHEGRWTLPSGNPLPFTDWQYTNRGTSCNCVMLVGSSFRMHDYPCAPSPSIARRFLCEVPQV